MRRHAIAGTLLAAAAAALLGACSDTRAPAGTPHPLGKAWVGITDSTAHGTSFLEKKLDCSECHDPEAYCSSRCHFSPGTPDAPTGDVRVPPGLDWTHGAIPHRFPAYEDLCNTCHDVLRRYGQGPAPCHDCHGEAPIPHALGQAWFIPDGGPFHGTTTQPDCSTCHAPLDEFCVTCHFDGQGSRVPPGVDWTHGRRGHAGSEPDLKPFAGTCTACHGITKGFTGQPPRTDCTAACHGFAMHPMPYQAPHQAAAKANLLPCRQCHDTPDGLPNFDGYVSGVACATCHPDAKAHPSPWYEGHRSVGDNWPTVCAICHNTQAADPAGPFPGAPSCFSTSFGARACHSGGPGTAPHASGRAWLDPNQPTFHGKDTNLALFPCEDCHSPLDQFCSTCHFGPDGSKVPAGVTWTHGRYPHDVGELVSREAVCNQCHALMKSYTGSPARTDCANCHAIAIPHGSPFLGPHTTRNGMDLALCQRCHGEPGTTSFAGGVVPQPVCSATCHEAARAHPAPWRLAFGTRVNSHKDAGNIPDACAICHDTVIGGVGTTPLPGAPPCRVCHPTGFVPHAVPFLGADLHGPAAKADLTFCQTCHADNPAGGPDSNPRFNAAVPAGTGSGLPNGCETCHTPGSAHATDWQGQNGNKRSHRNAGNIPAACNLCHGAALTGATAGGVVRPSCFASSFTNAAGASTACHAGGYQSLSPFHPATGWPSAHAPVARAGAASCLAECHQDTTSQAQPRGCAACHLGGASAAEGNAIMHPDGSPVGPAWGTNARSAHRNYAKANGRSSCYLSYCHGTSGQGGTPPPGGSWGAGPGCGSNNGAGCHD